MMTYQAVNCKYYGSVKGCRYGNNCRYSHSNPNSVPLCHYYGNNNNCHFGSSCKFRHTNFQQMEFNVSQNDQITQYNPSANESTNIYYSSASLIQRVPPYSIPSQPINFYPHIYSLQQYNNIMPYISNVEDDSCNHTAQYCQSVKSIINCLQYYHSLNVNNNINDKDNLSAFINHTYVSLLDDYVHILTKHSHHSIITEWLFSHISI